jgi:hypothetical protein
MKSALPKKICNQCNKTSIPISREMCSNCRNKKRRHEEPFYNEQIREYARNKYREKNGISLNEPINESQQRQRIHNNILNKCINFLLENGYEIKKITLKT